MKASVHWETNMEQIFNSSAVTKEIIQLMNVNLAYIPKTYTYVMEQNK